MNIKGLFYPYSLVKPKILDIDGYSFSAGNVGIGATSPTNKLEVVQTADADLQILFKATGTNRGVYGRFDATTNWAGFDYGYNGTFCWRTGLVGSDNFRIYDLVNAKTPFQIEPNAPTGTVYLKSDGKVGIGTTSPTAMLDVKSDIIRLETAKTPASAGATGNTGDICWDANFLYICIGANQWRRIAHNTW